MTRRSARSSKTRELSPDQTLTPSRRSSRTSSRKKKEDSETETEPEIQKSCRNLDSKMKDIEEKPEDESCKEASGEEKANGEVKHSSSHRRSRRSFKPDDTVDGSKKSSRSSRRYRLEEKEKIEEKVGEEPNEAVHNDEKNQNEIAEENEKDLGDETGEPETKEQDHAEEQDQDNSDKDEEKNSDKEEERLSDKDKERNSDKEEERNSDKDEEETQKEDEEDKEERSSSEEGEAVAPAPEEKTEEDDNAALEEAAGKESEEEAEEEDDNGEVQDTEADREEGEIEGNQQAGSQIRENGSPPPVWSGEQRRWGVSKSNCKIKFLRSRDPAISTSVLKELHTHVKPLPRDILDAHPRDSTHDAPAVQAAESDEEAAEDEPADIAMDTSQAERGEAEDENENPNAAKKRKSRESEREEESDKKSPIVRKVSIKKDKKSEKHVSPIRRAHKAPLTPTNVLFIYNLTRPFTLGQLRELLSRTGKIVPDGFWIDAIKSKCYVEYESVDQAEETRHALHEVRWPVTNDKLLQVEFTSKDAMLAAQIKAETQEMPTQRKTEPLMVDRNPQRIVTREWDMGKIADDEEYHDSRIRERDGDREKDRKRKRISVSPRREDPDARRRKRDTEAPAKLLDDLFKKTKAIPCLYWLPLTAEQIAVKEEMRKKHLAELEKRMKKSSGSRSSRDRNRRGRRS